MQTLIMITMPKIMIMIIMIIIIIVIITTVKNAITNNGDRQ